MNLINGGSVAIVLGMTDTDEKIPAAAGRISTQEGDASEIFDKSQDREKNAKLISKVTRSGHNSTIEHTVFNIAFKNVSVFAEQFLIEFRLASFTVKSRRYVDFGKSGFYSPALKSEEDEKLFNETMEFLFSEYTSFLEMGIPKEDARFILPYCLRSNFYCTVNARELLHILRAMLFGRGRDYAELKSLGEQIYSQIEKMTPGICTDFFKRRPQASDKITLGLKFGGEEKSDKPKEKVQLLSYTQDGEKTAARAALIWSKQYSPDAVERIVADEGNVNKILDCVIGSSRPRPLETLNYTFRLNGVSLSTITHFARHRMHGLMVPSLTLSDRTSYIVPDTVKANEEILKRYTDAFSKMNELYNALKAKDYSEEQLVYCLMSGNTLDIVSSMNGRELLLFMKLRTCNRAQWEIREYAIEMLRQLRTVSPAIFGKFGPSCFLSSCPEGALSCGKADEIKKFFGNM
ncbi:MAG: FAD-dependent thymidylate synthase [Clostridiales bacterium]|nr:FAD-dependent thymidylate synthase [Clostridiales bacterium]